MRFLLVALVGVGVWAQDGTTALHVAVYEDDVEAAGKLVRAGAGVERMARPARPPPRPMVPPRP